MSVEQQYRKQEMQLSENENLLAGIILTSQPIAVGDVQAKLKEAGKEVSQQYVSTTTSKMISDGVLSYAMGEGNTKLLSIAQDVELKDGKAYIPAPLALTQEDKLSQVFDLFGVKGEIKKRVLGIITMNPTAINPYGLHSILVGMRIDATVAKNICDTYFGSVQNPQGMNPYPAGMYGNPNQYGQQQIPQMLQPYGQQGATVGFGPSGQPFVVNPPTQSQPQSVPVQQNPQFTMRRIQRPMKAADGTFVKDAGGNFIYETIEEPVSASGNSNSDALTLIMTQQAERDRQDRERRDAQEKHDKELKDAQEKHDKELREEREKREKEEREAERAAEKERLDRQERIEKDRRDSEERIRQIEANARIEAEKAKAETEKLRQEALDRRLADIQKENGENIQGLFATVQKNSETLSKTFNDTLKTMQMENQHAREIDTVKAQLTAQSSAGERPIIGIGKELNRTMRELPTNIASAIRQVAPVLPQGIAGQIPQMTADQQAEAARKLAEQSKNTV